MVERASDLLEKWAREGSIPKFNRMREPLWLHDFQRNALRFAAEILRERGL